MSSPTQGRFVPAAYALSVYLVLTGAALVVLSYANESIRGKEYLHGVLAGALLMFLASPLLFLARLPVRVALRTASIAVVFWLVALATVIVLFFPLQTLGMLFEGSAESARPLVVDAVSVLVVIGIHVLVSGAVHALLDLIVATVILVRRVSLRALATAATVGAAGAGALSFGFASQGTTQWQFPPLTFDPRVSGSLALVGWFVTLLAQPASSRSLLPAFAAALEVTWLVIAPAVTPVGWLPPHLAIYAPPKYESRAVDGLTQVAIAKTEQRTGIPAVDDRLYVMYRDPDGTRFSSRHSVFPDANIMISVDGTVNDARREYVLRFQSANGIVEVAYPGIYAPLRVGYAYWSAEHEFNPFVTGLHSGESPQFACSAAPSIDFDGLSDDAINLSSLPFVVAERSGGAAAAQALFRQIASDPSIESTWRRRIVESCATFLARYAEPERPPLTVDESGARPGPDVVHLDDAEHLLSAIEERTGLGPRGRPMSVHYSQLRADLNERSYLNFKGDGSIDIVVTISLAQQNMREEIATDMAWALVAINYGSTFEPFGYAYAMWAASYSYDPFVAPGKYNDPRMVCRDRAKYALDSHTNGASYLASLPFVFADRLGGAAAANDLATHVFTSAAARDFSLWNARIAQQCEAFIAAL